MAVMENNKQCLIGGSGSGGDAGVAGSGNGNGSCGKC